MTHLTDQDINRYIHRSLTDAQRETMDRHLQECASCRTLLAQAERMQRQITYDLADELRGVRPSQQMRFNQIRPGLRRRQRWAFVRFHSMQLLSTVGTVAAIIALISFAVYMLGVTRSQPMTTAAIITEANVIPLFAEAWDDPAPYQKGLISEQQSALELLPTAPIYHIDMTVSEALGRIHGRQQMGAVNQTDQPLNDLYFHLPGSRSNGALAVFDVEVNGRPLEYQLLDDEAMIRVNLPETWRPGDAIIVEMAFELTPEKFIGVSPSGDESGLKALHLAQLNPTLAVYNPDTGWDLSLPSHDLPPNVTPSFYRVRVTAPANTHIIASGVVTGKGVAPDTDADQEVVNLAAGPIPAFYMTISNEPFQVAITDTIGETNITSYAQSLDQLAYAREAFDYIRTAVVTYNEQFGDYPFTELNLINVPSPVFANEGSAHAGVILLKHDPYQLAPQSQKHLILSLIASLWFDTAVAETRLQNPWLVDGMAEYSTLVVYERLDDDTAVSDVIKRWQSRARTDTPLIGSPASTYSNLAYFNVSKGKTPLFLQALADRMGQDSFDAFLTEYITTYRWGGANTQNFRQLAERSCDCDLTTVFAKWVTRADPYP